MSWRISFNVFGDNYSPKKVNFNFDDQNEPDGIVEKGRFKGTKYGYGSSSYYVPQEVSRLRKFEHLADLFEPMLDELRRAGAESWYIGIDRLYFSL